MKYINVFDTSAAYETAKENLAKPQLSLIKDGMTVYGLSEQAVVSGYPLKYKTENNQPYNFGNAENVFIQMAQEYGITVNNIHFLNNSATTDENGYWTAYFENEITFFGIEQVIISEEEYVVNIGPWLGTIVLGNAEESPDPQWPDDAAPITTVIIPDTVTKFISSGDFGVFSWSKLENIVIPSNILSMSNSTFWMCKNLTSITLPNTLTNIERDTFAQCTSLTNITIPASVTNIGRDAFFHCTSLSTINYAGTTTQWTNITKGEEWHAGCPATGVQCSDGFVSF